MNHTRVLIAEPQPITLKGTLAALEEAGDIMVMGTAIEGRVAINTIRTRRPDVAVIEVELPDINGLQVLDAVKELVPVIIHTAARDSHVVYNAMTKGAKGFIMKWAGQIALADAIRMVADGRITMCPASLELLMRSIAERENNDQARRNLTGREIEVMGLLAQSKSQKEIAEELGISYSSVRAHCRNAYPKLKVRNKTQAVREALRLGLI